jgi:tetratricopeptide (TPR) repeat protein
MRFRNPKNVLVVRLLSGLILALVALPAFGQVPQPSGAPASGSARWYYERAIVLSIEEKPQVIAELQKAIQADPTLAEAHYFLGKLLMDKSDYDGAISEFRATVKYEPNHLPAHLELARALQSKKFLKEAIVELESILPKLGNQAFDLEVARIKSYVTSPDAEKYWKLLTGKVEELLDWIGSSIKETPQVYQKFTTERGLHDESVLLELAEIYSSDEETAPQLLPKFLQAIIASRGGFFPIALLQYGSVLQKDQPKAALEAYQASVDQLKSLGLKEGVDFDVTAINELKKTLGIDK